jgi:predicted ATP-binding protein involved in virulence
MKIRRLEIKNFRGIREMMWDISGDMICMIGPSDSTKSTILFALEYLFYPNQNLAISDVDFYNMKADAPIEISAIISDLPKKINSPQSEDKFGLHIGFFNPQNGLFSKQKQNGFIPVLKIRLQIEKDLEAKWFIDSLQDDDREPLTIWGADRRTLGIARIGQYVDSDLSWGRDSVLSRLTQKEDTSQIASFLAETERTIHENIQQEKLDMLDQTISDVKKFATEIGVDAADLQAGVNRMRVILRQGAIGLHDGKLPFTMRGLGSRRLLTMAIHKGSVANGAVILIDEIENNLEPYRLRHLIRQIRPDKPDDKHQVIFTTHSPIAVVECKASELYVVRSSKSGVTDAKNVMNTFEGEKIEKDIQKIARSMQEAFLSPRVIICEGKTEAGFLIALDEYYWAEKHQDPNAGLRQTMAEAGVMPVESPAGGSESPKYAVAMAKLGYHVAYFGDSDRGKDDANQDKEMDRAGVHKIFRWKGNVSIEERLCLDLPWEAFKELIELAENHNGEKVWDDIRYDLNGKGYALTNEDDLGVLQQNIPEEILRDVVGKLAKGYKVKNGDKDKKIGEWFKRRNKSEDLGRLVARYLDRMQSTDTYRMLRALEEWAYLWTPDTTK